jgi:hypothetical protein
MSATAISFRHWQDSVLENLREGVNLLADVVANLPPTSPLLPLRDGLTTAREAWKAGDSDEVERILAWAHEQIAQHRERTAEAAVRARWASP